jgi:hypothetical protein
MSLDESRPPIDTVAQRLVGRALTGVRYWDTPCSEAIDDASRAGPHHVGHGVDLILGGPVVAITWERAPLSYCVAAFESSLVEVLLAGRFESVADRDPWASLGGRTIEQTRVHSLTATEDGTASTFPFALELRFSDGDFVVLAAASYTEPHRPAFPGGDDIVVAWTPEHVRDVLPDLVVPLGLT